MYSLFSGVQLSSHAFSPLGTTCRSPPSSSYARQVEPSTSVSIKNQRGDTCDPQTVYSRVHIKTDVTCVRSWEGTFGSWYELEYVMRFILCCGNFGDSGTNNFNCRCKGQSHRAIPQSLSPITYGWLCLSTVRHSHTLLIFIQWTSFSSEHWPFFGPRFYKKKCVEVEA